MVLVPTIHELVKAGCKRFYLKNEISLKDVVPKKDPYVIHKTVMYQKVAEIPQKSAYTITPRKLCHQSLLRK